MNRTLADLIVEKDALIFFKFEAAGSKLSLTHGSTGKTFFSNLIPESYWTLLHPDDQQQLIQAGKALSATGQPFSVDVRTSGPQGELHWLQVQAFQVSAQPLELAGSIRNITQRKATEQQLMQKEAQLQAVLDHGQVGVYIKDLSGHFLLANQYLQRLADTRQATLQGQHQSGVLQDSETRQITQIDQQVIDQRQPVSFEWQFQRGNQDSTWYMMNCAPYWQEGQVAGVVGFVYDITQRRKQELALAELTHTLEEKVRRRTQELQHLNEQLTHESLHDHMTGLPNRTQFMQRLQRALERKRLNPEAQLAVIFIDLDKFKSVNDTLGHAAGDALLRQVAQRLQHPLPQCSIVARLGGDEFVMLLEGEAIADHLQSLVQQVQDRLHPAYSVQGTEWQITASLGVTLGHDLELNADDILQEADLAMYRAKTRPHGQYEVFEPELRARRRMLLGLEQDLKGAVARGELFLEFQPIVHLPTGMIAKFEALVRWNHPLHGLINPTEFIPLAEEAGVMHEIDLWVLRQACATLVPLVSTGQLGKIAVNFSAGSFQNPTLTADVQAILQETNCPPQALLLEVTETILMKDLTQAAQVMQALRNLGVWIAADDFGTGYSSLSYLHRLPLTDIKLDRSFITAIIHAPDIVRTVMQLASSLHLCVVMEGVETAEQMHMLRDLNCTFAQGYYFSRPVREESIPDLLRRTPLHLDQTMPA